MIPDFVLGILAGYVAHQTEPWVQRSFGNGWRQMVSYVIGAVVTFPIALVTFQRLEDIEDYNRRFTLAWFVAFFSVGFGVLLGWIFYASADNGSG